jgi:tRNA pseudouridine65 synthase
MLDILYHDKFLIAVNKPERWFVHKTNLDRSCNNIILSDLRDQIGQMIFPVHRLDRKTSGVLLFALDKETQKTTNRLFSERMVNKTYLAIVRGHFPDSKLIEIPLINDQGKTQDATTQITTIAQSLLNTHGDRCLSCKYSLVEAKPISGRMHQIRKHLDKVRHPIIGDRPYGCNKQNRFFKEAYNMQDLMLHAYSLEMQHPCISYQQLLIKAPPTNIFLETAKNLFFEEALQAYQLT